MPESTSTLAEDDSAHSHDVNGIYSSIDAELDDDAVDVAGVRFLGDVELFGTAIYQTQDVDQRHAAIVFKDRDNKHMSLLHLAWHMRLMCDPLKPQYRCVPMQGFDEEELQYFAEHASRVYSENQDGIPYGINYTGAAVFDDNSKFLDNPKAGLTCATFILGFFENLGFQLLDFSSWESRLDDVVWQNKIYAALERELKEAALIEQKELIGTAFRFRPEEVISSAAIYDVKPIGFDDAVINGQKLLDEIAIS
ncbi:hypothetical protein [Pseudomonas lactucae]|uniref:hypothetical protein n=1 Tax=Pseudomonas lactucae TaxID=2813360 RepID=UPI002FCCC9F4